MFRFSFLLVALLAPFGLPPSVVAQEAGPEALETAVGVWEAADGAMAECDWLGDVAIVCLQSWTADSGEERQGVFVTTWDEETEGFTVDRFYSTGYKDSGFVWIDGNEWVYVFRSPNGSLYRVDQVWSADSVQYEWYRSVRGGSWEATGSEGTMTRTTPTGSIFNH